MTLTNLRAYADKINEAYGKVLDGEHVVCPCCGEIKSNKDFYNNSNNATGNEPYCNECIKVMACDYDAKTNTYIDNKEKAQNTLKYLNLPYLEDFYNKCVAGAIDNDTGRARSCGWSTYIRTIKSLPAYKSLTWDDSDFAGEIVASPDEEMGRQNKKMIAAGQKRFGVGFTNNDYMYLETQYQDWVTRYECNTKAQEELFERLSFKKWEINKVTLKGDNTKDLDRTYQDLLNTANITPKQQVTDQTSGAQTLGTLIQRWEEDRPLPEIDPELQDIDKIGLYIDTFFKGHMAKMLDLKNPLAHLYEKFMSKYTVNPPQYDEDGDSEILFEKIFGSSEV